MRTLALFILLTTITSSCMKPRKCDSKLINTINLTEVELSVNPYNGNEQLSFSDDYGNIITYKNGHRSLNTQEIDKCDEGCCDYYLVESSDNTFFESNYKESNLQIIISNNFDKYTGVKKTPYIQFVWDYYEILPYVTGTNFAGLPVDSMKEKGLELGIFRDSIILRGIKFYNIFELSGYCPYPDRLFGEKLYFSNTEGIIGLKLSDGNLLLKQ